MYVIKTNTLKLNLRLHLLSLVTSWMTDHWLLTFEPYYLKNCQEVLMMNLMLSWTEFI